MLSQRRAQLDVAGLFQGDPDRRTSLAVDDSRPTPVSLKFGGRLARLDSIKARNVQMGGGLRNALKTLVDDTAPKDVLARNGSGSNATKEWTDAAKKAPVFGADNATQVSDPPFGASIKDRMRSLQEAGLRVSDSTHSAVPNASKPPVSLRSKPRTLLETSDDMTRRLRVNVNDVTTPSGSSNSTQSGQKRPVRSGTSPDKANNNDAKNTSPSSKQRPVSHTQPRIDNNPAGPSTKPPAVAQAMSQEQSTDSTLLVSSQDKPARSSHRRSFSTSALPNPDVVKLMPGQIKRASTIQQAVTSARHFSLTPVTLATVTEDDISADNVVLDRQLANLKENNEAFIARFRELGTDIDVMQASIRLLKPCRDRHGENLENFSAPSPNCSRMTQVPASSRHSYLPKGRPSQVKTSLPSTGEVKCTSSAPTIDKETADFFESAQKLYQAMENRAAWLADEISAQDSADQEKVVVVIQCNICLCDHSEEDVFRMENCNHEFCFECMTKHICTEIDEQHYPISCPSCVAGKVEGGPQRIGFDLAKKAGLPGYRLIDFRLLEKRVTHELLQCPRCYRSKYMAKDEFRSLDRIRCPSMKCGYVWCKQCNQEVHSGIRHSCDGSYEFDSLMEANGWRRCPTCQTPIEMESGCHHVICKTPGCNTHFCYACGFNIGRGSRKMQSLIEAHYRTCTLFIVPPDI